MDPNMARRVRIVMLSLAVASVFSGSLNAALWVGTGHRHGWAVDKQSENPRRCVPRQYPFVAAVCATDDGGKHWRPIFVANIAIPSKYETSDYGCCLVNIIRLRHWSLREGSVTVYGLFSGHDVELPPPFTQTFWTPDAGHHWYPSYPKRSCSPGHWRSWPKNPPGAPRWPAHRAKICVP